MLTFIAAAFLGSPVAPPANLETTIYRVEAVLLYPADADGGLSLIVHKPGTSEHERIKDPIAIWGSRKDCRVWIDGRLSDRAGLLRWLPTARFPLVEIVRDMDAYGAVVEAKFTSRSK